MSQQPSWERSRSNPESHSSFSRSIFPMKKLPKIAITYLLRHVVIGSSVHVIVGPLEERGFADGRGLLMAGERELIPGFASEGVIKRRSLNTHVCFILFII